MTVINLIKSLAKYFDLQDDMQVILNSGSLEGETESGLEEFNKIILSINNTCEYLASIDKFALFDIAQIEFDDNKEFDLSSLQNRFYKLCKLTTVLDKKLKFDLIGKKLIVKDKTVKLANLTYSYLPKVVGKLEDEIDVNLLITNKVLLMGVMANYCFVCGLFDDGFVYEQIFEKELKEMGNKKSCFVMPNLKRWV